MTSFVVPMRHAATSTRRTQHQSQVRNQSHDLIRLSVSQMIKFKQNVSQAISHQQSFEVVQTLVLISVTSICFLRNLLPLHCFEDREYSTLQWENNTSYYDILNNRRTLGSIASGQESDLSRGSKKFKIIASNKSAASNKLLSWLDGAFDALEKKVLSNLQLSIIPDREKHDEVLEAYTFTFNYHDGHLKGVSVLELGGNKELTVKSTKQSIDTVLRYLVQLCQTLPELPAARFLTMHLFYTEECPQGYNPVGFRVNENAVMAVPHMAQWNMISAPAGRVNSGFHNVHLTASYLSAVRGSEADLIEDVTIPTGLVHDKFVPRVPVIEDDTYTQTDTNLDSNLAQNPQTRKMLEHSIDELTPKTIGEEEEELVIHQRMQNMIMTPSPPYGSKSTQEIGLLETICNAYGNDIWQPKASKMSELSIKREEYLARLEAQGEDDESRLAVYRCDCGIREKDGKMRQCDCCDEWQHAVCHSVDGIKFSEMHVCYSCLLGETSVVMLNKMRRVAQTRRIFWMVYHERTPADEEFAKLIGCDIKQLKSMIAELKREQIILIAPGSRSKAYRGPRFVVDKAKAIRNFQEQGLLHPLAFIKHLFEKVNTSKVVDVNWSRPLESQTPRVRSQSVTPKPLPTQAQSDYDLFGTEGKAEPRIAVNDRERVSVAELASIANTEPYTVRKRTWSQDTPSIIDTPKRTEQTGPLQKRIKSSCARSPLNVG